MLALVLAHALAALLAPWLVRAWGSRAFLLLATVPAFTAGWAAVQFSSASGPTPPTEVISWVDALNVDLVFRMDTLSWILTLIVGGVGALILAYCAHYFADAEREDVGRFAAYLTAFAGAMLGLVTTDDLITLYIFWELTTVLSYLLIGYKITSEASRGAAKQALIVTTFGGLAMLIGIILIGQSQGTYRISELLANPGSGGVITAGVVLLLVGAITKSALIPFHFWLPGAMAAPTPVSAYLHAAAMVKAGIYLVARFAPAYSDLEAWRWTVLILGAATMILGAYRALRQYDLKLVLAYGTVSQLGFLTVLVGSGSRSAALAGITLMISHALFKSSLFLTVGSIDHATGTRDLRELNGLHRKMPILFFSATAAAMSMAGLPPLLGFVGKEAAYTALLPEEAGWASLDGAVLIALVVGSALTLAYTARFLFGAFGPNTSKPPVENFHSPGLLMTWVPTVLGVSGLLLGPLSPWLQQFIDPYSTLWPVEGYELSLGLWHGFNLPLMLSIGTWVVGGLLFWRSDLVAKAQAKVPHVPSAGHVYQGSMRGIDRFALEVTGAFQRGSLPALLGIIILMLILLPGIQLIRGVTWPDNVEWPWERPAQALVGLIIIIAAIAATRARRRLRAVFLAGVVGYAVAMLFLFHGAPDLALTQVLVETVTLVVFILVLRRLSGKFPDNPSPMTRKVRALLGAAAAVVVGGVALTAAAVRNVMPAGETLLPTADDPVSRIYEFGYGENAVNVILVDTRAWDTMGELSVVLAAATGVASLVFLREDAVAKVRRQLRASWRDRSKAARAQTSRRWLAAAEKLDPKRRSTIFEVVTRLIFHTIMVWSVFLLVSGHNNPGGGFAAGLVAGLALALRYLAARGYELRVAAPVMPAVLLGTGMFIAAGAALIPMAFGFPALSSFVVETNIWALGDVKLVSTLAFDIGVYLVVVGLMLDILRSLGSAIDDQIAEDGQNGSPEGSGAAFTITESTPAGRGSTGSSSTDNGSTDNGGEVTR